MDPIITLATGTLASITAYAGQLFTDLELLIALAIGLPVAFWVISKAIGLVRARTK
jgi:hypothetical protein